MAQYTGYYDGENSSFMNYQNRHEMNALEYNLEFILGSKPICLRIDRSKRRAFFLMRDIVAMKPYHDNSSVVEWPDSSLRRWLNSEYYNSLPSKIKDRVVTVNVESKGRKKVKKLLMPLIYDEFYSQDRIFLLNEWEAHSTLVDRLSTSLPGTPYEEKRKVAALSVGWWLRDKEHGINADVTQAWFVDRDGGIGSLVGYDGISEQRIARSTTSILGVRPAFWLQYEDSWTRE